MVRAIWAIVFLLTVLPAAITAYWAYKTTTYVTEFQAVNKAQIAGDPNAGEFPTPPPSFGQGFLENRRERNLTDTDALTSARTVSISRIEPFANILNEGEAPPDDAFSLLYAEARASAMMSPRCAELLEAIGDRCEVKGASAKRWKASDNFLLTATYAYAPSYDIGETEDADGYGRVTVRAKLGAFERSTDLPADERDVREGYMRLAVRVCDAIRARYGNCVVTRLSLSPTELRPSRLKNPGDPLIRLSANASFSVHTIETKENTGELRKFVRDAALDVL
ncbi:MAG: hypothetical protein AAF360_01900 [Pseudomonadota bacterium]